MVEVAEVAEVAGRAFGFSNLKLTLPATTSVWIFLFFQ